MRMRSPGTILALLLVPSMLAPAAATDYPLPREGTYTARDFRFHTGEIMPELRLAYRTIGEATGEPVLILHGTTGSSASMLTPGFAGELFGPGQPLDARKYFIILPDALGAGRSSKPSDGLRTKFPHYNYDDMVAAQHRLLTEALGIRHLRLVLGNSMGGMHTWIWGVTHPSFMDALVPLAAMPSAMSGRNWMLRRMLIEAIRSDPDWNGGNYTSQPRSLRLANAFYGIATNGGTHAWQRLAPTRAAADKLVEDRLAATLNADANDFLYQWEASRDYDPSPQLERIEAMLLAINSADDERNPPELGIMERAIARMRNGRLHLIPGSADTRGHGTTATARHWKQQLEQLLQQAPRRTM